MSVSMNWGEIVGAGSIFESRCRDCSSADDETSRMVTRNLYGGFDELLDCSK